MAVDNKDMAILKRKRKQSLGTQIRQSVWPSMGWRRTVDYYRHRMFRADDSTYRIAAGLASGAAVSFSPFLGTHFVQSVALSLMLRANWVAGFVGTAFGNPWTFPFIFTVIYKVGVFICGIFGAADFVMLPDSVTLGNFMDEPLAFFQFLGQHPLKFLLPLTVGGYVCAALSWPVFYAMLYYPVRRARKVYRLQRLRRRRAKGAS